MATQYQTIIDYLRHWAITSPDKQVFSFINGRADIESALSFSQLSQLANNFAHYIGTRTRPGDRIALMLPTSPEFVVALFGSMVAGLIPVPLSQPTRHNGLRHMQRLLDDCGATLCLVHPTFFDKNAELAGGNKIFAAFALDQLSIEESLPTFQAPTHDLALLQYTSGSTSEPKGVMISHRNVLANQVMINEVFGHNEHTKQLNWMPLYHDMGLIGHVMQPLFNGSESYLMDPVLFVQRPRLWLESISRYGITSTGGPNFCYQHCVYRVKPHAIAHLDLTHLQVAYNGAEPVNPQVIDDFTRLCEPLGFNRCKFLPCFGLAEATLMVSGIRHDENIKLKSVSKQALSQGSITAPEDDSDSSEFASLGRVAKGESLLIMRDDRINPCGAFAVGEIWISGDNIAVGYWNNPQQTDNVFVNYKGRRYLRTGDLGFVDDDSNLFITGRAKDVIIIDGKNHYPQDIEFTTQLVDDLLRANACAAFVTVPSDFSQSNEQVVVVQELDRKYRNLSDKNQLLEIKERIKSAISQQHAVAVADVVLIETNTLPKTTSGKVQRSKVKQLYQNKLLDVVS